MTGKDTVPIFINRRKVEAPRGSASGREILALIALGEGYDLKLLKGEGDATGGECILADQTLEIRPGLHFRAVPGNCTFGSGDIPELLQRDADELSKHLRRPVRLIREGTRILVIVEQIPLRPRIHSAMTSDLLMITDFQYPMSAMDMFFLEETVTLKGRPLPQYASSVEEHAGRRWRRWSWHRNGLWKPGVDGLLSHWAFIEECWIREEQDASARAA